MRGHSPVKFDNFKGLWRRGDGSSCPQDHFTSCNNINFDSQDILNRSLFAFTQAVGTKILSQYVFQRSTSVLLMIGDDQGDLYKIDISAGFGGAVVLVNNGAANTFYGPWITINNRLYVNLNSSISDYFGSSLYTYDGTTFRIAGVTPPVQGTFNAANSGTAGHVDAGIHYLGVAYETDSGYISKITDIIGPSPTITAPGNQRVTFTNIPVSPSAAVVARRLISTRVIAAPTSYITIFQLVSYFIPNGRIADNTTTTITVDFTDAELLEESTYLNDIIDFNATPIGGRALHLYNNRLCMGGHYQAPLTLYVSNPGDYETFNTVDGVLPVDPAMAVPLSAFTEPIGITDLMEYRGTLNIWGYSSTISVEDNGNVPSSWTPIPIDNSLGALPGGVTVVYTKDGISVDYLLIASREGLYAYNGAYIKPEISWKIFDLWKELEFDRSDYTKPYKGRVYVINDIFENKIYILAGVSIDLHRIIIVGDYKDTSPTDPEFFMNIRWSIWTFQTATFIPITLFLLNKITTVQVIISEYNSNDFWLLDGTNDEKEVRQIASFDTSYIRDEEDNVLHYAAVRFSLRNSGTAVNKVDCKLKNVGDNREQPIQQIIVPVNNGKNIDKVTNFLAQQAQLHFEAKEFTLDKFFVYVKPTYKTIP